MITSSGLAPKTEAYIVTHPTTLNDTAILRTLNNLILKDRNSLAYKTTVARMFSNAALNKNHNVAFSVTEIRPTTTPSRNSSFYIDKVIETLHKNNLSMFNNSALHLTLKEMVNKYGNIPAISNLLLDHSTQLFLSHMPITRQQFINTHDSSVPLDILEEAHAMIKLKAFDAANRHLKTSDPYELTPLNMDWTFNTLSDNSIPI